MHPHTSRRAFRYSRAEPATRPIMHSYSHLQLCNLLKKTLQPFTLASVQPLQKRSTTRNSVTCRKMCSSDTYTKTSTELLYTSVVSSRVQPTTIETSTECATSRIQPATIAFTTCVTDMPKTSDDGDGQTSPLFSEPLGGHLKPVATTIILFDHH